MIDRLVNWVGQKPMWVKVIFWLLLGWAVAVIVILTWPMRNTSTSTEINKEAKEKLRKSIEESIEKGSVIEKEEEKILKEMEIEINERNNVDKKIDNATSFDSVDSIAETHFSRTD